MSQPQMFRSLRSHGLKAKVLAPALRIWPHLTSMVSAENSREKNAQNTDYSWFWQLFHTDLDFTNENVINAAKHTLCFTAGSNYCCSNIVG